MPGLYSVSLDEIAAETGISAKSLETAARSRRLSLTNAGRDVSFCYDPVYRRLLFAGEAYATFYTDENAYRLSASQTPNPQTDQLPAMFARRICRPAGLRRFARCCSSPKKRT